MMAKRFILALLGSVFLVSPAIAQEDPDPYAYKPYVYKPYVYKPYVYTPPKPYVYTPPAPYLYTPPTTPPRVGSTYDWTTGNTYNWTRASDGITHLRGSNLNTGSLWQTTIKPNGDMSGLDKDANYWTYNARTKIYTNTNGTFCVGEGPARSCF
jgi:hypothetical protein